MVVSVNWVLSEYLRIRDRVGSGHLGPVGVPRTGYPDWTQMLEGAGVHFSYGDIEYLELRAIPFKRLQGWGTEKSEM